MNSILRLGIIGLVVTFISCNSETGYEFMPNMYDSVPLETYGENPNGKNALLPVEGTISRGNIPFEYNEFEYLLAGENLKNPLSKTNEIKEEGKLLYGMMCAHCHGVEGKGDGSIAKADFAGNPYTSTPGFNDNKKIRSRNGLTMNKFTEGHIFHTITYGMTSGDPNESQNAMGPHSSQLSVEERWKIVYYIQEELQKASQKK